VIRCALPFYTSPVASHCLLHCFLNLYLFIADVIQRSEVKQTALHNSTPQSSALLIYYSHLYCLQGVSSSFNVLKPCKRTKTIMKQRKACDVKENFQAKVSGWGMKVSFISSTPQGVFPPLSPRDPLSPSSSLETTWLKRQTPFVIWWLYFYSTVSRLSH